MKDNQKALIFIIALFSISFVLYFQSLGAPFVFDDFHMIVRNNLIKNLDSLKSLFTSGDISSVPLTRGMYRPLLMLSFAFNYFFARLNPLGYHIIDIMFHFLNAVLFFFLLRILLAKKCFWPAALATLLFLVHPINSEAIIYISCRSTLMFSFFFLAGLLSYVKSAKIYDRYFWFSIVAFICGLLSKEPMIMFPVILVIYDLLYRRRSLVRFKDFLRLYLVFILVALLYLLLRQYLIGGIATIKPFRGSYENILTQLHVSIFYFRLFLYPVNLCLGRFFPTAHSIMDPAVMQAILGIAALSIFVIYFWKKAPILVFAILWYFVNLVPKFIGNLALVATEHHLYLSGLGIIMVIAFIFDKLSSMLVKNKLLFLRKFLIFVLIAVLILLSFLTLQRNEVWKGEYNIWLNNIKYSPMAWGAYNNLGLIALNEGRLEESRKYFLKAIEGVQVLPARELEVALRVNLAQLYIRTGELKKAENELRKAMEINQYVSEVHNNLGLIYEMKGMHEEGIKEFQLAVKIDPSLVEGYTNLGVSYWQIGRLDAAIEILKKAISVNPDYSKPYLVMFNIYEQLKDYKEAAKYKKLAMNFYAVDEKDYYDLGIIYGKMGDIKAVEAFEKAVELEPKFAAAHYNLAVTYANLNPPQLEPARKHALLALKYGFKVRPEFLKQLGIKK